MSAPGEIFNYTTHRTWEFTSTEPVRSVFPLWLIYGAPLALLQLLWSSSFPACPAPPPRHVFAALRTFMFLASFILEDWAIHELVPSPRRRLAAVLLVASSYVTWTYQTHTFSNAIETIVVLWCLVLVQRILGTKVGPASRGAEGNGGLWQRDRSVPPRWPRVCWACSSCWARSTASRFPPFFSCHVCF